MSTDKLKVGLVGASATRQGWGPVAHMPAIAAVEDLELAALCTSSPAPAAAAGDAYGIPRVHGDVRELAAQPDIDFVTVAVRVPHHHSIVMPLLEAGKHVYCEWPLGATTTEATEMAAAAEVNGVITVAGLQGTGLEAYGTEGTLVAPSPALPQITPILLSGARGGDPLAHLDVPVGEPAGVTIPAGPGHHIARSYAPMAQAIRDGAPAEPDLRRAVSVHRLLDALRASSDGRQKIGVDT